jgi:tetratricopeptide (TPR) repeat protein
VTDGAPPGLRETILRRVDLLGEDTRRVLAAGSVLGRTFELALLAEMTGVEEPDLRASLADALAAEVVVDAGRGRFTFAHALLQDAMYDQLGATRRARLHLRAAEAIRDRYPEALATIAHHQCCSLPAGDRADAVEAARRAGRDAAARGAHEQAAEHFERALEVARVEAGCCIDPVSEGRLLCELGEACLKAGATDRSAAVYLQAIERARAAGDAVLLAEAAIGLGGGLEESVGFQLGQVTDELIEALADARIALPDEEDAWYALVTARLAAARYDMGEVVQAQALSAEALDVARASGDPRAIAVALAVRHMSLSCPDALDDRLALDDELRHLGAPPSVQAVLWRVGDLLECGRLADADAEIAALERGPLARSQPRTGWYVAHYRAMRAALEGRIEEARRLVEVAGETGTRLGARTVGVGVAIQGFFTARELGQLDGVAEILDALWEENPAQPGFVVAAALARTETGRFDEARAQLGSLAPNDFAVLPRNGVWLGNMWTLAEVCLALQACDEARTLYAQLLPFRDRYVVVSRVLACQGSVEQPLGLLALTAADLDAAAGHLARAHDAHVALGAPLLVARTELAQARLAARRGDVEGARATLDAVFAAAREHGWPALAADARAQLALV